MAATVSECVFVHVCEGLCVMTVAAMAAIVSEYVFVHACEGLCAMTVAASFNTCAGFG